MSYNDDYLFIAFDSNRKLKVFIEIDGSGEDGRWASTRKYSDSDNSDGKTSLSDSYAEDAAFMVEHGKRHVICKGQRLDYQAKQAKSLRSNEVEDSVVASGTRNQKNRNSYGHIIEVKIPRKLPPGAAYTWFPGKAKETEGLTLKPGTVIGVNFYVGDHNDYGDSQFSGLWGNIFETYHFVDVTLSDDTDLDGDGLDATAESIRGTDPTIADTDGDGIPDAVDSQPAVNLLR